MGYKSLILLCSGLFLTGNCLAEVELRWGIDEVLAHQIRIAREVKEKIEKKTNGEVRVKIELYGEEHLKSPQKERFDIHQTIVGNYSERVPELKIWEIPYLFQNKAHVETYMTSSRGQATLAKIEDEKWLPINYSYAGGFLHFYSKKKISNFSDLKDSSCGFAPSFGFYESIMKPIGVLVVKEGEKENCFEALSSEVDGIYARGDASDFVLNLTQHRVVTRATYISKDKLKAVGKWRNQLVDLITQGLNKERKLVYEGSDLALSLVKNRGLQINGQSFRESIVDSNGYQKMISKLSAEAKAEYEFIESLNTNRKLSSLSK